MQTGDPQKTLASALGRIPSGVFVLTAAHGGVETGMLASWVQQCAFKPPIISFVILRGRPIAELLPKDADLTLNILEANQTDLIAHFGKGFTLNDDAFHDLDIQRAPPHGPILTESLAFLHGKVLDRIAVSDHDLYVAEVTAGALLDDGQPMVHIRKNGFHY
jgi:flavin reductase (DIM6/NTAB) family NADH-FMN oxidoreductase RutF